VGYTLRQLVRESHADGELAFSKEYANERRLREEGRIV
jgi:hypothetical protein